MRVKTITVKRTVQVKQFEPLVMEVVADINEDEDPFECIKDLSYDLEEAIQQHLGLIRPVEFR